MKTKLKYVNVLKKKFRKYHTLQKNLEKVFNQDQRECIIYESHKGRAWSSNTVTKALRLISAFKPEEKHAVLLIDEMSIKPGVQFVNSIGLVVGKPTMKLSGGYDSSKGLAIGTMNVALSVALLNDNVAAAITFHITKKNIDKKHTTTAWFISLMHKWFKLMTSRYEKLALSYYNMSIYNESITFLQEFIEIITGITVDDNNWKPFQTGLLLCTKTALDLQAQFLSNHNFRYLLLRRCTQDALENLFSMKKKSCSKEKNSRKKSCSRCT
ncbi:hypothetical protein ALC57_04421 [Trachymyrmex cornetzi]|uniref:THAP domain-containing protein 9 n=1 Tax=Trachymyrmex cornetzi TaxID=471704 RepID=A0A151JC50_9HYME|nr:hypothetical protein ALC57_04421 [Trachymyrmex cornetzi]